MQSNALHFSRTRKPTAPARSAHRAPPPACTASAHLQRWRAALFATGLTRWRFGTRSGESGLAATVDVEDAEFYADVGLWRFRGRGRSVHARPVALRRSHCPASHLRPQSRRSAGPGRPVVGAQPASSCRCFTRCNRNSRSGSARNIAAHYDLGNPLYELMLDDTMAYSCGIFESPRCTLHEAQVAKFDAVCRKLALTPGIICSKLARAGADSPSTRRRITAAASPRRPFRASSMTTRGKSRAARSCGTHHTADGGLSRSRRAVRQARVHRDDRSGRSALSRHVCRQVRPLLKPEGAMLLQAITIRDQLYAQALRSVDFIQRFIFPGSFIPSIQAIGAAFARATDMKVAASRGYRPALRDDAPRMARPVLRQPAARCARLGIPRNSCGCGSFTCATAKPVSQSASSAMCRCCSQSPGSEHSATGPP